MWVPTGPSGSCFSRFSRINTQKGGFRVACKHRFNTKIPGRCPGEASLSGWLFAGLGLILATPVAGRGAGGGVIARVMAIPSR